MGYGGHSGPSRSSLAALKQFKLVEGRDQTLRLTKLAISIVNPMSEGERAQAISEAAEAPAIYGEIRGQFGGRLPSDQVLKAYLIRQHQFSPSGADSVLRTLRDTRIFADRFPRVGEAEIATPDGGRQQSVREASSERPRQAPSGGVREDVASGISDERELHQVRISADATASLELRGKITKSAIDHLIRYLELAKTNYPAKLESD
jgi:hypothetical protein